MGQGRRGTTPRALGWRCKAGAFLCTSSAWEVSALTALHCPALSPVPAAEQYPSSCL